MTTETGSKPPTREERKRCWFLRDKYFGCLDKLDINDPTIVDKNPEKATECLELKKGYEEGCMASWVSNRINEFVGIEYILTKRFFLFYWQVEYFNKRRVLDLRQKQYLEFSKNQSGKQ